MGLRSAKKTRINTSELEKLRANNIRLATFRLEVDRAICSLLCGAITDNQFAFKVEEALRKERDAR